MDSFIARAARLDVDEPGICGELGPRARLLVTDDRAHGALTALLPAVTRGTITVWAPAERCAELIGGDPSWRPKPVTPMVCRSLERVPAVPLPAGLALRPVGEAGVPLELAAALAIRADPSIEQPLETFTDFLRSLPPQFRLLAAVDTTDTVRATAGAGAFGLDAMAFFVNTDPDWRRRGIGRAMTAAALHVAHEAGATRARLDASRAGLGLYLALGFEVAGAATQYFRAA